MKTISILGLLVVTSLSAVNADTIFEETFNTYEKDQLLPAGAGTPWYGAPSTSGFGTYVRQDTQGYFGHGTTNRYLEASATNSVRNNGYFLSSNALPISGNLGTVGQISFQIYQPGAFTDTMGAFFDLTSGVGGNANLTWGISFSNGKIYLVQGSAAVIGGPVLATYDYQKAYTITLAFNNSLEDISYDGHTLESGGLDLWIDGELVAGNLARYVSETRPPLGAAIDSFNLKLRPADPLVSTETYSATIYIDSIKAENQISIPEPSLAGLAAAAAAALLLLRKGRRLLA